MQRITGVAGLMLLVLLSACARPVDICKPHRTSIYEQAGHLDAKTKTDVKSSNTGMLIGALLGAAVGGTSAGKGKGKAGTAAVGALIGAGIGHLIDESSKKERQRKLERKRAAILADLPASLKQDQAWAQGAYRSLNKVNDCRTDQIDLMADQFDNDETDLGDSEETAEYMEKWLEWDEHAIARFQSSFDKLVSFYKGLPDVSDDSTGSSRLTLHSLMAESREFDEAVEAHKELRPSLHEHLSEIRRKDEEDSWF